MGKGPVSGRLFLAAPLDDGVRRALAGHLTTHLGSEGVPGRRVPPENWHFTLKFLGDTSRDDCGLLLDELGATDLGSPFEIEFDQLGAFPNPRSARVVWIGVSAGAEALGSLASAVEKAAARSGFEAERRRFSAHLTLSRLRPERDVRELLVAVPRLGARMAVEHVVLYRSHLGPSGARYEAIERLALDGERRD